MFNINIQNLFFALYYILYSLIYLYRRNGEVIVTNYKNTKEKRHENDHANVAFYKKVKAKTIMASLPTHMHMHTHAPIGACSTRSWV
jgi:hypothetical protein